MVIVFHRLIPLKIDREFTSKIRAIEPMNPHKKKNKEPFSIISEILFYNCIAARVDVPYTEMITSQLWLQ